MASSVGGFTAPGMIAHYFLRTSEEVTLSKDGREFSPVALLAPLLSLVALSLTAMAGEPEMGASDIEENNLVDCEFSDEETADEKTPLRPMGAPRRRTTGDSLGKKVSQRALVRGSMFTPMTLIGGDVFGDEKESLARIAHPQRTNSA